MLRTSMISNTFDLLVHIMKAPLISLLISLSLIGSTLANDDNSMKVLGDTQIKLGLSEMESGDYKEALHFLRLGVFNSPGNLEGRKALAEFYEVALKRPDKAAELLVEGVNIGGIRDLDYVKYSLRLLLRNQMDAQILELTNKHLPPTPDDSEINKTLAFGAANACYLRGNYDQADVYLNNYDLLEITEGVLLLSQISWDRGNQLKTIHELEDALPKSPKPEPILMQLSRYHRKMGNLEEAKRYAILRIASDPLSYAARAELLYILHKTNDLEGLNQSVQKAKEEFQEDREAMQTLANFAADTGNPELAQEVYDIALDQNFKIDAFALLLIESLLTNNDYLSAKSFADSLYEENPEWLPDRWAIFSSLRAVISAAINGTEKGNPAYLRDFLSAPDITAQTYIAVARRFAEHDCDKEAFKVLSIANEKYPTNQKVITEFIQSSLEQNRLDEAIPSLQRLITMRHPDKELLSEILPKLESTSLSKTDREALTGEIESILQSNES